MTSDPVLVRLKRANQEGVERAYKKCMSRLPHDPAGALTSARTLLEEVCHYALDVIGVEHDTSGDLPKLYRKAAEGLSISPQSAISHTNKKIASAVHTIVQSVGELRNEAGDSHGRAFGDQSLTAQAKMAVDLALAVANFILASIDTFEASTRRSTPDGNAILKFDKATVWRLVDHSQNSRSSLRSYGEKRAKRSLWLVGDAGIYLMSNGSPPIMGDGRVKNPEKAGNKLRLVAYAEGCGPDDQIDNWWGVHGLVADGSDFSLPIPISYFRNALENASSDIIVVGSEDGVYVYGDREYAELCEFPVRQREP